MNSKINKDIFRVYTLDYIGTYHFYEEEEFIEVIKDAEYILENLKKSNRFDYNKASYTFTKYGNISEGITKKNVNLEVIKDEINVRMDSIPTHLNLIYKMDVKELEDHYRIATTISEVGDKSSVLLYINKEDGEDLIDALKEIKKCMKRLFEEGKK